MNLLVLIACGAGPDPATPPPPLPACAPWSEWAPVEGGRVVHCDDRRLHVSFPAGSADALSPAWREAVTARGWTEQLDTSAPGLVAVRYGAALDGSTLALTLVDAPSSTELAATVNRP